jgi:hypothetical protein
MWKCYANILRAIRREVQIKVGGNGSWIDEPLNELGDMMLTYPDKLMTIEQKRVGGEPINNQITPGFG